MLIKAKSTHCNSEDVSCPSLALDRDSVPTDGFLQSSGNIPDSEVSLWSPRRVKATEAHPGAVFLPDSVSMKLFFKNPSWSGL